MKTFLKFSLLGAFLMFFFMLDKKSNFRLFEKDAYFYQNSKPNTSYSYNYLNQLNKTRILAPVIQSDVISGDYIKLFIPLIKRNEPYIKDLCGEYIKEEGLSRRESKLKKDQFRLSCFTRFYKISIDNGKVIDVKFSMNIHENNGEKGILTFILIDQLEVGNHLLNIERGYTNENGDNAIQYIPFYRTK